MSDKVDLVATDEHQGYKYLGLPHEAATTVRASTSGARFTPQNMESFWSLLKRGVIGTFHNISKEYLPLYLAEFTFRFNNRKNPDIFAELLSRC